jgi:hypothetical protein
VLELRVCEAGNRACLLLLLPSRPSFTYRVALERKEMRLEYMYMYGNGEIHVHGVGGGCRGKLHPGRCGSLTHDTQCVVLHR